MSSLPQPDGPDINIGEPMMKTVWTLYGFTIVIVATRLYAQVKVARERTLVSMLGDILMTLSVYHYGLGRHFYYLDDYQRVMAIKFNFIGQAFGVMAPTFGRMACTMLMLQLFGTTKWRYWGLWTIFWQSLFVNSLTVILIFVQCEHVQTLWDSVGHPGRCWSPLVQEYTGFVQGGLNAATDLLLTLIPTSIFWSLKISVKLKCGLGILLGLSIFAFVAVVIKTVELQSLGDRGDFTFNTVSFFTWVVVECTLVNIAASVPLIHPLFGRYWNSSRSKISQTYEMKRHGPRSNKGVRGARLESIDIEETVHNASEENILPEDRAKIGVLTQGIVMKTTYNVNFEKLEKGKSAILDTQAWRITESGPADDRDALW